MSFTTPSEIDTEIARLSFERSKLNAQYIRLRDMRESDDAYYRRIFAEREDEFSKLGTEIALLSSELVPLNAEYNRQRWSRYYHVTNQNGHIHSSMRCSSCFDTTEYGWRTDLSGLSEAEVVEREAYNACSVCMPIAPAEQKAARARYNREQREARAADKAAIKADKDAAKAERARKHVEKVAKALCEITGEVELFEAVEVFKRDYSQHGHDGKKSAYEATFELPTMVGDTIYYMAKANGEVASSYDTPNEFVMNALRAKEMI